MNILNCLLGAILWGHAIYMIFKECQVLQLLKVDPTFQRPSLHVLIHILIFTATLWWTFFQISSYFGGGQ